MTLEGGGGVATVPPNDTKGWDVLAKVSPDISLKRLSNIFKFWVCFKRKHKLPKNMIMGICTSRTLVVI